MSDDTVTADNSPELHTGYIETNGVDLFVRSCGTGSDVVMIHGGPSAGHHSLLPAMDDLAAGRCLHYYDQRGCGKSRVAPRTPLDWRHHVGDLHSLMNSWQIDSAILVGHSWGALLALLYAIEHPKRTGQMLLVSPAPVTAADRRAYLEELNRRMSDLGILRQQRELIRSGLRNSDPSEFRRRAFELTLAPYLRHPYEDIGVRPFTISQRVRQAVWKSLGDYDLRQEFLGIGVPCLVAHGEHDPIPLRSSRQLANMLGARLEVFEDSGHMPFFEERERFVRVADDFLPSDSTADFSQHERSTAMRTGSR